MAYLGVSLAWVSLLKANQKFRQNDQANISNIGGFALGIVGLILAAYVGVQVVASLLPTYAGGINSITENLSDADWGDDTANSLGPVLGLVAALVGMFGIAGLIFTVVKFRSSKGG